MGGAGVGRGQWSMATGWVVGGGMEIWGGVIAGDWRKHSRYPLGTLSERAAAASNHRSGLCKCDLDLPQHLPSLSGKREQRQRGAAAATHAESTPVN